MHPDDLRLLRELRDVKKGSKVFKQRPDQSCDEFELDVLRLLDLRARDLITMSPEPFRSSRGDGRYQATGECRLTLQGREALARHSDAP